MKWQWLFTFWLNLQKYYNIENLTQYAVFHEKSESAIRISLSRLEKKLWAFKVKWVEQVMVKLMWPN